MVFPTIAATYGAILGLYFVALSIHVVVVRARENIHHGDGDSEALNRSIRSHGNFSEHVPFALILIAWVEMSGFGAMTLHLLLAPLLVARLMHPIGMRQPIASKSQYAWRATSVTVTWVVIAAASILVLRSTLGG